MAHRRDRSLDIRLRLAGALSLALAALAGGGLGHLAAAAPAAPASGVALAEAALAAVMIAGASVGAALATLGARLLDEVTVASPRRRAPPRDARVAAGPQAAAAHRADTPPPRAARARTG